MKLHLRNSIEQGRATDLAYGLPRLAEIVSVPAVRRAPQWAPYRQSAELARAAALRLRSLSPTSIRHSGTRNIRIALRAGAAAVEISARDDGAAPAPLLEPHGCD